jgi:hypothetical protein
MVFTETIINKYGFISSNKFFYEGKLIAELAPYSDVVAILGKEYELGQKKAGLINRDSVVFFNNKIIAEMTSVTKEVPSGFDYLFKIKSKQVLAKYEGSIFNKKLVFYIEKKTPCMEYLLHLLTPPFLLTHELFFDKKNLTVEEAVLIKILIIQRKNNNSN